MTNKNLINKNLTESISWPACDFCHQQAAEYDGKTKLGHWAYMCERCFVLFGVGLGLGRGWQLPAGAMSNLQVSQSA